LLLDFNHIAGLKGRHCSMFFVNGCRHKEIIPRADTPDKPLVRKIIRDPRGTPYCILSRRPSLGTDYFLGIVVWVGVVESFSAACAAVIELFSIRLAAVAETIAVAGEVPETAQD